MFLVLSAVWCIIICKDLKMPVIYQDLKETFDEIVGRHNSSTFKAKMLRLTISVQHLNKNDKEFRNMDE